MSVIRSKRYSHISAKVDTGLSSASKHHNRPVLPIADLSQNPQPHSAHVVNSVHYVRPLEENNCHTKVPITQQPQSETVVVDVNYARCEEEDLQQSLQKKSVENMQSVHTRMEMEIDVADSHQTKPHVAMTVQHTETQWSDEHDSDPQMVSEYAEEIFLYLREIETKTLPSREYMQIQREVDWSMRGILVNWLVEVHHRLRLLPETLFLTVNLMDRFLSAKAVSANKLQLVGVTSLLVACKVEEISVPSVQVMVYMSDNGYSSDEILKAERYLLGMLKFNLGSPSPFSFLRRISRVDGFDPNPRTLCKYLMEATLVDESMVGVPPSLLAAGAMYLARKILTNADWTIAHVASSSYTEEQVFPCAKAIFDCVSHPERHQSIYQKYAEQRYMGASKFIEEYVKRLS